MPKVNLCKRVFVSNLFFFWPFSGGRRWMRLRVEGEKKGGNGRRLREGGDEVSEEMGARVWGRR